MPIFKFEFKGGSSFTFTDLYPSVSKVERKLKIKFPNGNILEFNDVLSPHYPSNGIGFMGQTTSEILTAFREIGISNFNADTKQLREDTIYYPGFFKSNGENIEFNYEYFPSGVYEVTYSYLIDEENTIIIPPPELSILMGGGNSVSETQYIFMDQAANICLKRKIEWLFKNDLEYNTSPKEYNLVKDQIIQLIMMLHIAQFDYDNAAYQEANLKLLACDNICATGNLGYLYDSTRP